MAYPTTQQPSTPTRSQSRAGTVCALLLLALLATACARFDLNRVSGASWYGRVDSPEVWFQTARDAFVRGDSAAFYTLLSSDVRAQFSFNDITTQWSQINDRLGRDVLFSQVVHVDYLDGDPKRTAHRIQRAAWRTQIAEIDAHDATGQPLADGADTNADVIARPELDPLNLAYRAPAPEANPPTARLVLSYPHPITGTIIENLLLVLELDDELGDTVPQWRLTFPFADYQDHALWIRHP